MVDKNVVHVARTIALSQARRHGWLEGMSLQEVANRLGNNNHRATILRNLRSLDKIEELANQYIELLAPQSKSSPRNDRGLL